MLLRVLNPRTPAIGAMRLSTDPARDADRSIAALHAAFDAGVTLVDTADAYALDDSEIGHNERLIARALDTWRGARAQITVITKGGLTRPAGRWVPDGRARHLREACARSRAALGVERLALYQLHAPDPRVPWTTSVRALAALLRDAAIDAAGLCNVTVQQIEAARAIVPITTVQIELSPWKNRAIAGGVVDYCTEHGIRVLAYRPFGGVRGVRRIANDAVLGEIAGTHNASPFAIVLAWMRSLSPHIVPLPGPTRPETARDCALSAHIVLSAAEQETLDRHLPIGRLRMPARVRVRRDLSPVAANSDIVMIMGLPGAGKTTMAAALVAQGYERLNRDESGGSLDSLAPRLAALLAQSTPRIVLDNTYLTRASRAAVLDTAAAHQRSVRGIWLDTSLEDAQMNVVHRMLDVHGRLLTESELKAGGDPASLAPTALFRAHRQIEMPDASEGLVQLERIPFVRRPDPTATHRAVILWCDDATLTAGRDRLAQYSADGWQLFGLSWQPQIADGAVTAAGVDERFANLRERLDLEIEFTYCPHGGGPPTCWCRKPLPGLGVVLIRRHRLDSRQCLYVGGSPQDPGFARRLGFEYRHVLEFFDLRSDQSSASRSPTGRPSL